MESKVWVRVTVVVCLLSLGGTALAAQPHAAGTAQSSSSWWSNLVAEVRAWFGDSILPGGGGALLSVRGTSTATAGAPGEAGMPANAGSCSEPTTWATCSADPDG